MRTALGAPDPGEFERRQPHNLFNDRRVGGKAKNRAYAEMIDNSQGIKKSREHMLNKNLPRAPKQFN
jgi:hypothetical protein